MASNILKFFTLWLLLAPAALAQTAATSSAAAKSAGPTVACRVMEVINAERLGVRAVIFHQRDKADGPRLGELLQAHSGEEVEF